MKQVIKTSVFIGLLPLVAAANISYAQQHSGVTITPSVGYYVPDDTFSIEDHPVGGLALGYQFASRWAAELNYFVGSADIEDRNVSLDLDQIYLTGLYHFADGGSSPYLLFGAGQQELARGRTTFTDSIVALGAGYKFNFGDAISLRPDLRLINNLDEQSTTVAVMLGLSWLIGGQNSATPANVKELPVIDSDADGIADSQDQCLNSKLGIKVDQSGCEIILDADHDGIADTLDKCPGTSRGAKVDNSGCYILLTTTKEIQLNVIFENNSFIVSPLSYSEIQQVVDFMQQYPVSQVLLEGHTDDRGSAGYNQQLSLKRAQAVSTLISEQYGIDASRIEARGLGEAQPLYSNDTAENRAKNRRVTAKVSARVKSVQP